jgi:hypothetical protein
MSRIRSCNLSIAGIAAGSLMALVAAGRTAPKTAATIVEQDGYFALPGKAEEVYRVRVQACDVLEKLGLPRGRVLRRMGKSETLPDVMWQMEFPDDAARQRNLKIRLESPEFAAVRDQMKVLISRGELGVWQKD